MTKIRILLLGNSERACLATIRSLKKYQCSIAYFGDTTAANYSRYCVESFPLGDPSIDLVRTTNELLSLISRESFDLLLPVNDVANEVVYCSYDELSSLCKIVAPSRTCYERVHSKVKLINLAASLDIPIPQSIIVSKPEEVETSVKSLKYPCYVKPEFSSATFGNSVCTTKVRKAETESEVERACLDNIAICPILVQKSIDGHGVGVNIFAVSGIVYSYCVSDRLHEPADGGPSSYRRTRALDKRLREYADKLVSALSWTGFMMIEFKDDGDDYYLMEINPRLWGSIGLCMFSGVDFVEEHVSYLLEKKVPATTTVAPEGYRTRHLLKDLKWLVDRRAMREVLDLVGSAVRLCKKTERYDVESISDPLPAFAQFIGIYKRIRAKMQLGIVFAYLELSGGFRACKSIRKEWSIAWICKGNINRSVFAQCFWQSFNPGGSNISCGTLDRPARLMSAQCARYLQQLNIKAGHHLSSALSALKRQLDNADLLITFDKKLFVEVWVRCPEHRHKLYMLRGSSIQDPNGHSEAVYQRVFDEIQEQMRALLREGNEVQPNYI